MIMREKINIEDVIEINIELKNGENTTLFCTEKKDTVVKDIRGAGHKMFFLYTDEELERFTNDKHSSLPCICFMMPSSDIRPEMKDGFLTFYKDDKIIFMESRNNIKRIRVGVNENWLDLCE